MHIYELVSKQFLEWISSHGSRIKGTGGFSLQFNVGSFLNMHFSAFGPWLVFAYFYLVYFLFLQELGWFIQRINFSICSSGTVKTNILFRVDGVFLIYSVRISFKKVQNRTTELKKQKGELEVHRKKMLCGLFRFSLLLEHSKPFSAGKQFKEC